MSGRVRTSARMSERMSIAASASSTHPRATVAQSNAPLIVSDAQTAISIIAISIAG